MRTLTTQSPADLLQYIDKHILITAAVFVAAIVGATSFAAAINQLKNCVPRMALRTIANALVSGPGVAGTTAK